MADEDDKDRAYQDLKKAGRSRRRDAESPASRTRTQKSREAVKRERIALPERRRWRRNAAPSP